MVLKHIKRLPKRRFAYVTLQNSRISDETIFSGHKSFKFPAQRGIVIYLGTFSHSKLVSGHTTSLMSKPCSSLIHHGSGQWKWTRLDRNLILSCFLVCLNTTVSGVVVNALAWNPTIHNMFVVNFMDGSLAMYTLKVRSNEFLNTRN